MSEPRLTRIVILERRLHGEDLVMVFPVPAGQTNLMNHGQQTAYAEMQVSTHDADGGGGWAVTAVMLNPQYGEVKELLLRQDWIQKMTYDGWVWKLVFVLPRADVLGLLARK